VKEREGGTERQKETSRKKGREESFIRYNI
jgi:hypothetical protein